MLSSLIQKKVQSWLHSPQCSVKELIKYIRQKNELREPQIGAIETYLFLKIVCKNKPLWQLFAEGFFIDDQIDLSVLNINQHARDYLTENKPALSLFDFARKKENKYFLPNLEQQIIDSPKAIDYEAIIKKIFYNVSYADYLMSLPMGAGKTYLMAALIYLDLYFALQNNDDKNFAHNFLILIPSGLKSSIGPSLRTIEHFDPEWILKQPAANNIKKLIHFEILDEAKTARKSNKVLNPNAQKVNQSLKEPFGRVFVVNAEKVILNRLEVTNQQVVYEQSDDEKDRLANELRNLIGKIPRLSIFIDEVHHATNSEIKLRQVVNKWHAQLNITTILGFSGTPYLSKTEKISLTKTESLKVSEITNTVYYYPLHSAIELFLKKPKIKTARKLIPSDIIKSGIEDFQNNFDCVYQDGTIAKLAIYCSTIEMLEEEVYPFLQEELKINQNEILRFHGGNKKYKLAKENVLEFKSLDSKLSKKKYRYC